MSAINPDLGPDPVHRLTDGSQRTRPMSRFELHTIFRQAVLWELAEGGLSTSRRRRLVQYAAALRISATEAGELIQEALEAHQARQIAEAADRPKLRLVTAESPEQASWPVWAKLSAAVAAVITLKVVLDWVIGG